MRIETNNSFTNFLLVKFDKVKIISAKVLIVKVLANPGKPSRNIWPSDNIESTILFKFCCHKACEKRREYPKHKVYV